MERLEAMPDGRLAYRLKTRWRDGTTHILMERSELLERLAPLIPPPRAHQVRYHGLLAPCASGRDRVVPRMSADADSLYLSARRDRDTAGPGASPDAVTELGAVSPQPTSESGASKNSIAQPAQQDQASGRNETGTPAESAPAARRTGRHPWAELLQRVFEIDVLCCPNCGGKMRILAAITDPDVARRILECLSLPARAPPNAPAEFSERQPVPVFGNVDEGSPRDFSESFDFDQSQAQDWDIGA